MIKLTNLSVVRGSRVLLGDVNLTLFSKQKIALVGKNGSGKSSLFAMLLGELEPSSGTLEIAKSLRIAHVAQETPALEISASGYVLQGDKEIYEIKHQMEIAESSQDYEKLAHLHVLFAELDGYRAEARVAQLLHGLGFSPEQYSLSVAQFSGGWRMRLNLAQALMCPSDILLLDEPTNHLDINTIIWLEKWLQQYAGTLLIISHDRAFLDHVTEFTVHIRDQTLKLYSGNYSSFEVQYQNELALQQALYDKQQRQISHMMKFVDRFKAKASKAKQAQSRLKQIAKITQLAAIQATTEFNFEFRELDKMPRPILSLQHATMGYADHVVLQDVNLQLDPGDRLALLGVNGAGKSTLIKSMRGEIPLLNGEVHYGNQLRIGYFAQHQIDYLDKSQSPLEHLQEIDRKITTQQARNFLGGFAFNGEMGLTKIENFSGGEKARLALALIVWQSPHLLLLDEPTNHLDMDMRNALTLALQSFQGAMILVSHDRSLLESTTDRLYVIRDKSVTEFKGDIDDYQNEIMGNIRADDKPSKSVNSSLPVKSGEGKEIARLEKRINELQQSLQKLNDKLSDPDLYLAENSVEREKIMKEHQKIETELQLNEEEWLKLG